MVLTDEAVATRERGYDVLRALVPIVTAKPEINKKTGFPEEDEFGWFNGVFYHFPRKIFEEEELYKEQPAGIVSRKLLSSSAFQKKRLKRSGHISIND